MPIEHDAAGAVLVLKIFLALVPKLLAFMNTKQGMISQSGNDFGVVKKYFIFQVHFPQEQQRQPSQCRLALIRCWLAAHSDHLLPALLHRVSTQVRLTGLSGDQISNIYCIKRQPSAS